MPDYIGIDDSEIAPEAPVTTSLMTRLRDDALAFLGAPTATKILLRQAVAPLGWVKVTSGVDNRAIRVVSGTLSDGGSSPFSTVFGLTATQGSTLSISQHAAHAHGGTTAADSPSHLHNYLTASVKNAQAGSGSAVQDLWRGNTGVNSDGPNQNHAHAINTEGSGSPHEHPIDLRVQYIDVCVFEREE